MSWIKLDDGFCQHPKVLQAGPLGIAMQVAAIGYCNRHLTDGFVPRAAAATLLCFDGIGMRMWAGEFAGGGKDADWTLVVEDLVAVGMWKAVDGGWNIHDYLDFQPAKCDVLARRQATTIRVAGWRGRNGNGTCNPVTNDVGNAVSTLTPGPDPDPKRDLNTSRNSEKREAAKRLIGEFNRLGGKRARITATNIRAFEARLADTSESDITATLAHRHRVWSHGDGAMLAYFTIETLTRPSKFEKYLTEYLAARAGNGSTSDQLSLAVAERTRRIAERDGSQ